MNTPPEFTKLTDLAAEKIGGKVLYATDDFFAEKENLLKSGRGIFIPDKYTERGKWMDGWESRRKRTPGHDHCIIQLGASGIIRGLDIDTNHFLGNHPPFASVEALCHEGSSDTKPLINDDLPWTEILPKSSLEPGSQNFFEVKSKNHWTHLKLHIYPDGGVARFKVYGEVHKNWNLVNDEMEIDLAAAVNGARAVLCNDMFFSHMQNLTMPGRGVNMGDGWETKRNRTPNNRDWVIVKLAHPGNIHRVLVDTCHFKGNYPDCCSLQGSYQPELPGEDISDEKVQWNELLPKVKLTAHCEHFF